MTVDLDGVLVIAHSDKEDAAPTWQRTYGHHPLMGFVDHGSGGIAHRPPRAGDRRQHGLQGRREDHPL